MTANPTPAAEAVGQTSAGFAIEQADRDIAAEFGVDPAWLVDTYQMSPEGNDSTSEARAVVRYYLAALRSIGWLPGVERGEGALAAAEAVDVSPVFKQLTPEEAGYLIERQRQIIGELNDSLDAEKADRSAAEHRAAELVAQNAALRAATKDLLDVYTCLLRDKGIDPDPLYSVKQARAALATTPAEALAVVREHVAASEEALTILDQSYPNGGVTITGIRKRASAATDAARRLYGSAR